MPLAIHRVTQLDLKCGAWTWPFAVERRADIDAHFARQQAEKPKLWNGRVLLGPQSGLQRRSLQRRLFRGGFCQLSGMARLGFSRQAACSTVSGWARCAATTARSCSARWPRIPRMPGGFIFPSGTPDLDDLRGDMVDIAGSVAREVEEETGLTAADYRADDQWDCVVSGAASSRSSGFWMSICRARHCAPGSKPISPRHAVAGTLRHPSGARACRFHAGDAALCHGVHRGAGCVLILSSTGSRWPMKASGFSLIGKCPIPFMMVTSAPGMLAATASVSSGVQE